MTFSFPRINKAIRHPQVANSYNSRKQAAAEIMKSQLKEPKHDSPVGGQHLPHASRKNLPASPMVSQTFTSQNSNQPPKKVILNCEGYKFIYMEKASLFSRHSELQQLIHAKEQSMKISGNPIRKNSPPSLQLLLKKKKI